MDRNFKTLYKKTGIMECRNFGIMIIKEQFLIKIIFISFMNPDHSRSSSVTNIPIGHFNELTFIVIFRIRLGEY